MSLRRKYEQIVRALGSSGALGAVIVLGSAVPAAASQGPAVIEPSVSARLAAIREAVSAVAEPPGEAAKSGDLRLAWGNWWRNFGWGRPWGNFGYYRPWNNWHNWNNWNNFWRNW